MTKIISLSEQINCLRREIAYRQRVYPRWIEAGKLKAHEAEYQLAAMTAAMETLRKLFNEQNPELLG